MSKKKSNQITPTNGTPTPISDDSKPKPSIVIVRESETHALTVIGEEKKVIFYETTAIDTLVNAYAFIYKLIIKELYKDQSFTCGKCHIIKNMITFIGMVILSNQEGQSIMTPLCKACEEEHRKQQSGLNPGLIN